MPENRLRKLIIRDIVYELRWEAHRLVPHSRQSVGPEFYGRMEQEGARMGIDKERSRQIVDEIFANLCTFEARRSLTRIYSIDTNKAGEVFDIQIHDGSTIEIMTLGQAEIMILKSSNMRLVTGDVLWLDNDSIMQRIVAYNITAAKYFKSEEIDDIRQYIPSIVHLAWDERVSNDFPSGRIIDLRHPVMAVLMQEYATKCHNRLKINGQSASDTEGTEYVSTEAEFVWVEK